MSAEAIQQRPGIPRKDPASDNAKFEACVRAISSAIMNIPATAVREGDLDAFLELGKPELRALGSTESGAGSEENEEGAHLGKIGRSEAGARSIDHPEMGGRGRLEAFDLERS